MPFGYHGKVAVVDLSRGQISILTPDESLHRQFFGGSGLVQGLLRENADWLMAPWDSDENPLIFMAGLLTGTPVPTGSKLSVCTKSPLTGLWTESTVGGHLGARLKAAGWDGLIVLGRAERPMYLWLNDDDLVLRPAAHVWGKDVYETDEILRGETGTRSYTACIGPAGENGVLFASIVVGGAEARAAGRAGVGTVMGAKNLKAVVVSGSGTVPLYRREQLLSGLRTMSPVIRKQAAGIAEYGTAGIMQGVEKSGDLPIHNWRDGNWTDGAARCNGQVMRQTIWVRHYACYACPIHCGKDVRVEQGPHAGTVAHYPEYETTAGFGAMCLNDDLASIVTANDLCNRLGLDTISTASLIAFAMEAFERGHLTRGDTGGLDLHWGNAAAILALIPLIAERRGLGRMLSGGVARCAEELGQGSAEYAMHVKGLEMAFHDPRAFTSMAVSYATGNRGGCHLEGLTYFLENGVVNGLSLGFDKPFELHGTENKAQIAVLMQNFMSAFNSLGLCKFLMRGGVTPATMADWINLVTNWNVTSDEVMRAGARSFNLARLHNVRLGVSRKDDTLPPRLLASARPTGGAAGVIPDLGRLLSDYYSLRDWSEEGIPTEAALRDLGLA
jgi:aldehyde:ferredoxin oxidoreductase